MAVSVQEIERELRLKLSRDGEIQRESREFAEDVRDTWIAMWESMGPHPYETGDYVDSIEVHGEGKALSFGKFPAGSVDAVTGEKIGGRFTGKNVYARYRVSATDWKAFFIEYGTGPDTQGVGVWEDLDGKFHKSPLTPTEEFAPAAHTAAYYHGTGPD